MSHFAARAVAFLVRHRVKPALADMRDLQRVRATFSKGLPPPRGVRFQEAIVGGVAGEWVEADAPREAPAATLLYLHGGGFVGCSPRTHRPITASLALRGLRVFVPDYRLAPEHPFPAALDDARAAWLALHAQVAGRCVVAGDSAGGNLALALMISLRDDGHPLPDAATVFSPAADLTGGSASLVANTPRDAMFHGPQLQHLADAYLAGADPAQPLASPLLGDLRGLPPLLVHVGEAEVLRDDSLRLAEKARAAGVLVQLQVFPVVPHVWQMVWRLREARRSLDAAATFLRDAERERTLEHHDVLIVGAGLSGIGAAAHLQDRCPDKTWAILESRQAIGGTWDLFRYPGVRSDSDMYTLGYEFKTWREPNAIAAGPVIRRYVAETAAERGIDRHVRFGHRVVAADWSAADARWTVEVERGGERLHMTCSFLLFCAGYYRHDSGHRPAFPGEAAYRGTWVHPQFWPEGLDHAGKRVLVIGSGATAVTLVPAMAETAAHVTMLQRSPSYCVALPARDAVAKWLERWLPARLAYRLVRAKNVLLGIVLFHLARRRPQQVKARLTRLVRQQLGADYDVERHFTPRYDPWDQRVCLVPDGDLFKAIRAGRASVVTDTIETFTERGVRLRSGQEIEADIVVTATGLELNLLGDVAIRVGGERRDLSQALAYKATMFSDVPNLASTFGYTNASWTLRADLVARYVCRLLRHMDRHGYTVATPQRDPAVAARPFLDFTSGYVQRALARLPRQGDRKPWVVNQNYLRDWVLFRLSRVADGVMVFARSGGGGHR